MMVLSGDIAVVVGDGVSVLHSDGHRYECKVKKIEGDELYLHWHGYGKTFPDFWLARDSDKLGLLEEANILPRPPTKSMKDLVAQAAGVANQQQTISATDEHLSSCTKCSGQLLEDHVKCDFCGYLTHFTCSGLPDYMLVRFLQTEQGYMCEPCVKSKWSSEKISDAETKIKCTKQKEEESKQQVADLKTNERAAATPKSSPPVIALCQRYRRGQCPHGLRGNKLIDGKKCAYAHPPKCRKFCSAGVDKRFGCRNGKKCKFLHPILCQSSGRGDQVCTNESCKLTHLKGARRENVGRPHPEPRGSQNKVKLVASIGGGNTNQKANAAAPTGPKNDQLERIEKMILSMKTTYDEELKALRQELAQRQGPPMPWMGPYYPWMSSPHPGLIPASGLPQHVPASYGHNMQRSSL